MAQIQEMEKKCQHRIKAYKKSSIKSRNRQHFATPQHISKGKKETNGTISYLVTDIEVTTLSPLNKPLYKQLEELA
jgi:hypothetical protein